MKNSGLKIKVIEKTGTAIKSKFQKSNPFKKEKCEEDCMVCQTNGKGNCEQVGVTYEIECQRCKAVYVGETSRNAKKRGSEHMKELKEKRDTSVLWRHCKEQHATEEQPYEC